LRGGRTSKKLPPLPVTGFREGFLKDRLDDRKAEAFPAIRQGKSLWECSWLGRPHPFASERLAPPKMG